MNQWAKSRKRIIFLIVFSFFVFVVAIPTFLIFYSAPTCFDNRQNGKETGVDCGGDCARLCQAESLDPLIKGDPRVIALKDKTYEVVVLFDNPNVNGTVYRARYTIRLYAENANLPIKIIDGETHIPKNPVFAVFEGPFLIEGGSVPIRASFEWKPESLVWGNNPRPIPEILATPATFTRLETQPRVEALVENKSLESVSNIELIALVSDEIGNVFAASKTFIENLPPNGQENVIFTWPRPFDQDIVDTEIIIRIFPDRSFIR